MNLSVDQFWSTRLMTNRIFNIVFDFWTTLFFPSDGHAKYTFIDRKLTGCNLFRPEVGSTNGLFGLFLNSRIKTGSETRDSFLRRKYKENYIIFLINSINILFNNKLNDSIIKYFYITEFFILRCQNTGEFWALCLTGQMKLEIRVELGSLRNYV